MERRRAITTAAAASLTLLAGAAGIALSSGVVGAGPDDGVGRLSPVTTAPPVTVWLDQPGGAPAQAAVPAAPVAGRTDAPPVTTSEASAYAGSGEGGDDDGDEGREAGEHEEHDEDDDERRGYEGADDDD